MTISKKAAKEISSLFNRISVAESMIERGGDYNLWFEHITEAVNILRDKYGIPVVGY